MNKISAKQIQWSKLWKNVTCSQQVTKLTRILEILSSLSLRSLTIHLFEIILYTATWYTWTAYPNSYLWQSSGLNPPWNSCLWRALASSFQLLYNIEHFLILLGSQYDPGPKRRTLWTCIGLLWLLWITVSSNILTNQLLLCKKKNSILIIHSFFPRDVQEQHQ